MNYARVKKVTDLMGQGPAYVSEISTDNKATWNISAGWVIHDKMYISASVLQHIQQLQDLGYSIEYATQEEPEVKIETKRGHEHVIGILMKRDKMDHESAKQLVLSTVEEIEGCNGDYDEAVDVISCSLGLEPDYLLDLI